MQMRTHRLAWLGLGLALTAPAWVARAQQADEPPAGDAEMLVQGQPLQPSEPEVEDRQATADREEARASRERERAQRERERVERLYERATEALDEGKYERAIEGFEELAAKKGKKGDAALYWKAYALQKQGRRPEALATLERLRGEFPQSRWLNDGQALELEVRQKGGERPSLDALADDDLKIFALSQLMNGRPEEAGPMLDKLEKLVASGKSPRVREQALFVLCQSGTPRAREIVARIARGQGSPALESKAIQYLGMFGGQDNQSILGEIYAQSQDPDKRRAVLRGFMMSGDKARVLQAVRSERDSELRLEALHTLGMLGGGAELHELYRSEASHEAKTAILRGLMMAGDAKRLIELARAEKDPELRREAVRTLSRSDAPEARQFMLEILDK